MKVWWKYLHFSGSEVAKLVQQLVMDWRVQGSIPGGEKGFSVLQNLSRLYLGLSWSPSVGTGDLLGQ